MTGSQLKNEKKTTLKVKKMHCQYKYYNHIILVKYIANVVIYSSNIRKYSKFTYQLVLLTWSPKPGVSVMVSRKRTPFSSITNCARFELSFVQTSMGTAQFEISTVLGWVYIV